MELKDAIREAVAMMRPAHVVEHKGGNFRAYETEYDEYTGTVVVIITDNIYCGGHIFPVGTAERALAVMLYESIGGPSWDQKFRPEITDETAEIMNEQLKQLHVYPWVKKATPVKPIKKLKKLKRRG